MRRGQAGRQSGPVGGPVGGLVSDLVRVRVPATTANMGPGFDCMGAALSLFNHIEVGLARRPEIVLEGEVTRGIPRDESNLTYRAAQVFLERFGESRPLHMRLSSSIPPGRGLGSSAACIAGGMTAANALLGSPVDTDAVLSLASRMEGHPDNVTPAILGGLTLATFEGETVLYRRLEFPPGVVVVVAIPDFALSTEDARGVVPPTVGHSDAAFNLARAAMMTACLAQGDLSMLGVLCRDRLHQPYRGRLVPGLVEILDGACASGALACYLSGAGPSVACLVREESDGVRQEAPGAARQPATAASPPGASAGPAALVGRFMVETFAAHGLNARFRVLTPCATGAEVDMAG